MKGGGGENRRIDRKPWFQETSFESQIAGTERRGGRGGKKARSRRPSPALDEKKTDRNRGGEGKKEKGKRDCRRRLSGLTAPTCCKTEEGRKGREEKNVNAYRCEYEGQERGGKTPHFLADFRQGSRTGEYERKKGASVADTCGDGIDKLLILRRCVKAFKEKRGKKGGGGKGRKGKKSCPQSSKFIPTGTNAMGKVWRGKGRKVDFPRLIARTTGPRGGRMGALSTSDCRERRKKKEEGKKGGLFTILKHVSPFIYHGDAQGSNKKRGEEKRK